MLNKKKNTVITEVCGSAPVADGGEGPVGVPALADAEGLVDACREPC